MSIEDAQVYVPGPGRCCEPRQTPLRGHPLAAYVQCMYDQRMGDLRFEWDPRKAAANLRKHGVSFNEAQTAFSDEYGLIIDDEEHSGEEERFVLLGMSATDRTLVVVHCYRAEDLIIRIISARKADRIERRQYQEGNRP